MKGRLLALALLLPIFGGCATKRDLRDLRTDLEAMRASQEAVLREIQRQNATILDSIAAKDVRLRGDLANRFVQVDRQLVQIQELTGQGQQRLADLRRELRDREEAMRAAAAAAAASPVDAAPADVGEPDEVFQAAQAALERGSSATARAGFEEFVRAFPQDPRAAEALLLIGEAHDKAEEPARAVEAYQRVLELYPNSPRAATALYRAALIESGRGNRDRARSMLNQVTTAYPKSPEAKQVAEQLRKLR
jgi:tol-pal system protein YbgF